MVSDLHICWNTVGCSLCSSDQPDAPLVPRGSGLYSHLSRRHLWCPGSQATYQGVCPPGVSVVRTQVADLGAGQRGFRCVLGLLIRHSQSRGWAGRGARGHGCCGEFSNYLLSASIFFFFLRNSSYSSPPGPNKHQAAHTALPGSLPRILQQTVRLSWGFSRPGPHAGPGDLIVLKHSSYHQIFHCPLALVSDLHICWNTVGCSLCSSDQLGFSLVLRGSGLRSHLSRRHLSDSAFHQKSSYLTLFANINWFMIYCVH